MVDYGLLGKPRCRITLIGVAFGREKGILLKFNPYKYEKYLFLSALTYKTNLTQSIPCKMNLKEKNWIE